MLDFLLILCSSHSIAHVSRGNSSASSILHAAKILRKGMDQLTVSAKQPCVSGKQAYIYIGIYICTPRCGLYQRSSTDVGLWSRAEMGSFQQEIMEALHLLQHAGKRRLRSAPASQSTGRHSSLCLQPPQCMALTATLQLTGVRGGNASISHGCLFATCLGESSTRRTKALHKRRCRASRVNLAACMPACAEMVGRRSPVRPD